jgi:hypothetical protein
LVGFGVHKQAAAGAAALQFKVAGQDRQTGRRLVGRSWDHAQPLRRASKAVLGSMIKLNIEASFSVLVAHHVAG